MSIYLSSMIILISVISTVSFEYKPLKDLLILRVSNLKTQLHPWRFLSYGFIHKDYKHLLENLALLCLFTGILLRSHAASQIVIIFLLGTTIPAIIEYLSSLIKSKDLEVIGASSGSYAVMGFALMENSNSVIRFFGISTLSFHVFSGLITYKLLCLAGDKQKETWHLGHLVGLFVGLLGAHFFDPLPMLAVNTAESIPFPAYLSHLLSWV